MGGDGGVGGGGRRRSRKLRVMSSHSFSRGLVMAMDLLLGGEIVCIYMGNTINEFIATKMNARLSQIFDSLIH